MSLPELAEAPKDLIRKLLIVDQKKRFTIKEALNHSFFHTMVRAGKLVRISETKIFSSFFLYFYSTVGHLSFPFRYFPVLLAIPTFHKNLCRYILLLDRVIVPCKDTFSHSVKLPAVGPRHRPLKAFAFLQLATS